MSYCIDKDLFNRMLSRLLNAPINLYFDKTPTGTVHKRMNDDLNTVSRHLPGTMKWNLRDFLCISATILFICYNSPICALVVPCVGYLFYTVLKDFLAAKARFSKLSSDCRTPLHTHISESIDGATTMRTYNRVKECESKAAELYDTQYACEIIDRGLDGWLVMRLNAISMIFVIFTYMYSIFNREGQSVVLVGMTMGYMLELQWNLNGLCHQINDIYSSLVKFEKCKEFETIPQEAAQHIDLAN